jgi:hypothetical protein
MQARFAAALAALSLLVSLALLLADGTGWGP